jgi:predicted DNA-binding protein (MmcQ/YjbR family)
MNAEELRDFAFSLTGTSESLPFDKNTLVFKVLDKMYLLLDLEKFDFINVKCDPEVAVMLREKYSEVSGGYHMSKTHWNSIAVDGNLSDNFIKEQVRNSYNLVRSKLKVAQKAELLAMEKE